MRKDSFDLVNFLPEKIFVGCKFDKKVLLHCRFDNSYIHLSCHVNRDTDKYKTGIKTTTEMISRYIPKTKEAFEVLGLLQAEMGKTQNGCLTFCNHEYQIIKKVLPWFEKIFDIRYCDWKWYLKVNLLRPENDLVHERLKSSLTSYWLSKIHLNKDQQYPCGVSYVLKTKRKKLKPGNYGTLIVDFKRNLLSQIIKFFLKKVLNEIVKEKKIFVKHYMRGIIGGESNVEINLTSRKFRVFITAVQASERKVYRDCLNLLGVETSESGKLVIISRKKNLLLLLELKLMCSSPQKYNKFLRIFKCYQKFPEYYEWRAKKPKVHNKTSSEVIDRIISLHHKDPSAPAWKIAEQVGVSPIFVSRLRKKNNLGKKFLRVYSEDDKAFILTLKEFNPFLTQKEIAGLAQVNESVVCRVLKGTSYLRKRGRFSLKELGFVIKV